MITDKVKDTAKGAFASSLFALVGAVVCYFIIKAWQKARSA
jgi:uncharacterized membrane protein YeaQ/YmgE (transglycosylase-associated protein family)